MSDNLSSQQFDTVHEIYNKQDGEMIGYFLQSRPGIVTIDNLQLVPISEKFNTTPGAGDLSCSSQNITSEDSKEIDNKKEIIHEPGKEVEEINISKNETKIDNYYEDEPLVKTTFTTQNIIMASSKKSLELNSPHEMSEFMKPVSEGWRRECATKKGKVTKVYYLTPPDREGNSKRLTCIKNCLDEVGPESELSSINFSFVKRALGLPSDVEIIRESLLKCNGKKITFKEYYLETDKKYRGKMLVECKLCCHKVCHSTFSIHMRKYHLPDEICPACGFEIQSLKMANHIKTAHMAKTRGQSVVVKDRHDMLSIKNKQISTVGDHNYKSPSSSKTTNIEEQSSDQYKTVDDHDQKKVVSSSSETPPTDYTPACSTPKSNLNKREAVSAYIELGMSLVSPEETTLLTNKPINMVTEEVSVQKRPCVNNDNNLVCDTNIHKYCSEVVNNNIKDVSPSKIYTSAVKDIVVITFECVEPKSKKKFQIAGNIPVSKAVNKFSKLMGLSIDDFTFKSGNILLTGVELTENLPSYVVIMVERK